MMRSLHALRLVEMTKEWGRDDKKEGGILSFSGNYLVGMIYLCIFAAEYDFLVI